VTNPVILVHTGVYRDESLFMDYSATVLGAGVCCRCCLLYCLCLRFHCNFPGGSGLSGVFIEATDDGSGWCSWNYRSCKLQSSSQIVTTNKPTPSFFTCRMPFLSPNQQCQIKSLKGEISLSMNLLTPTSPGGRPTFVSDH